MNLDALNKATAQTAPRTSGISAMMELEVAHVYPNPDQPRKHFDPVSLLELAESIKAKGLMQPIVVVRRNNRYMIISGQRRWEAHKINGSMTIRAIVSDRDDLSIDEMALIENIQRDDLTDYEIAMAIVRLWNSGQYEQKADLAKAIAKPPSYVSKAFACVNLDQSIKTDIEEHKLDIGLSVLQELSRVKPEKQSEVFEQYKAGQITRDQFKEAAKLEPKTYKEQKLKDVRHVDGAELCVLFAGSYDMNKKYRLTIEEIA